MLIRKPNIYIIVYSKDYNCDVQDYHINFSGINRNFQMIFLHDKLNNAVDKKVSTKNIWSHLRKMYDLSALVSHLSDCICLFYKMLLFVLKRWMYNKKKKFLFPVTRCHLVFWLAPTNLIGIFSLGKKL